MRNKIFTNYDNCHHMESYHLGPKVHRLPMSEQNQEWEANRPDTYWLVQRLKQYAEQYYEDHKKQVYNRKYTNNLTSHNGESRNYRADKMSSDRSIRRKWFRNCSKRFLKDFYKSKRRMFLKNPNNWDKI